MPSHRLLVRAGYVRQLGSGIYSLLPLGFRVNKRVEQIIREEQDRIGGQEMEMPVVHPADIWKASGRYDAIGPELTRFKDRSGPRHGPRDDPRGDRRGCSWPTSSSPTASCRDGLPLPDEVARRATVARRPDPRPRVRHEGRLQLRPRRSGPRRELRGSVRAPTCGSSSGSGSRRDRGRADVGIMGGTEAHEFMVLNPAGEDIARPLRGVRLCGEPADRARSRARPRRRRRPCRWRRSRRPATTTIDTLATFLGIREDRTAKAAFFVTGDGRLVTAIVRGDHEVNETKLANAVGRHDRAATRDRSRRSRRPAWSPATARRSAHATRSSSSTSSSRVRRTSSPAQTATDTTSGTSTSGATTRPTSSPRSRTPGRAIPAPRAARP